MMTYFIKKYFSDEKGFDAIRKKGDDSQILVKTEKTS